jgi:hypothetical protein
MGKRQSIVAKPTDWKTEPLPSKRSTIRLGRTFSLKEMEHIGRGLVPEQMEDKWFIYWQEDTLYFHRSWTGVCIYTVQFTVEGDKYRMIEADVNRDPEQYQETSEEIDAAMISYLIDILLLDQESVFPGSEQSPDAQVLMKWSQIGRAMLGQHPEDE